MIELSKGNKPLFAEGLLSNMTRGYLGSIQENVDDVPQDEFLAASDDDVVANIRPKLEIEPLRLGEPVMEREPIQIETVQFGRETRISGQRLTITFPFEGLWALWRVAASGHRSAAGSVRHHSRELRLYIDVSDDCDGETINSFVEKERGDIDFNLEYQRRDLEKYHAELHARIMEAVTRRRRVLKTQATIIAGINIPLKAPGGESLKAPSGEPELEGTGSDDERRLRVFLCHATDDKDQIRTLYQRLLEEGFQPWLDEEDLLAGQEWRREIPRVVRSSDAVIICLSPRAVDKKGFLQKEIRIALDTFEEQPEGSIYLLPVKLEECRIPDQLGDIHSIRLTGEAGFRKLVKALRARVEQLSGSHNH